MVAWQQRLREVCQVVFESRGKVVRFVVVAAIDDHRPIRLVDCLYEALHSDFVPWDSEEPFSAHHWGGGDGRGRGSTRCLVSVNNSYKDTIH